MDAVIAIAIIFVALFVIPPILIPGNCSEAERRKELGRK